jgi:hypothetical protein
VVVRLRRGEEEVRELDREEGDDEVLRAREELLVSADTYTGGEDTPLGRA